MDMSWRRLKQCIQDLGVNSQKLSNSESLLDFAVSLRNGSVLCSLLNKMHKDCILDYYADVRDPNRDEFSCKWNIRTFLKTCENTFHIGEHDLFQVDDLYQLVAFERVLHLLSLLLNAHCDPVIPYSHLDNQTSDDFVADDRKDLIRLPELVDWNENGKDEGEYVDEKWETDLYMEAEMFCNSDLYNSLITFNIEDLADDEETYTHKNGFCNDKGEVDEEIITCEFVDELEAEGHIAFNFEDDNNSTKAFPITSLEHETSSKSSISNKSSIFCNGEKQKTDKSKTSLASACRYLAQKLCLWVGNSQQPQQLQEEPQTPPQPQPQKQPQPQPQQQSKPHTCQPCRPRAVETLIENTLPYKSRLASARGSKKEHISQELLQTEESYVDHLNVLITEYLPALEPYMTREERSRIFLNLEDIGELHKKFCEDLQVHFYYYF